MRQIFATQLHTVCCVSPTTQKSYCDHRLLTLLHFMYSLSKNYSTSLGSARLHPTTDLDFAILGFFTPPKLLASDCDRRELFIRLNKFTHFVYHIWPSSSSSSQRFLKWP